LKENRGIFLSAMFGKCFEEKYELKMLQDSLLTFKRINVDFLLGMRGPGWRKVQFMVSKVHFGYIIRTLFPMT
jgi:hypothetical protein